MTATLAFPPELERLFLPPFDGPRWGWSLTRDGRPWSVATDGRSLLALAVASDLPAPGDDSPGLRPLPAVLEAPMDGEPVVTDVSTLRAWCGPMPEPQDETCDCCSGKGWHECPQCDDRHECGLCQGTGRQDPYKPRPQVLAGLLIDAGRLARLLEGRPPGPCTVTRRPLAPVEGSLTSVALRVDGAGWFALLMELAGERAGRPEFQASAATEALAP